MALQAYMQEGAEMFKELISGMPSGSSSDEPLDICQDNAVRAILAWAQHSPDRAVVLNGLLREVQWPRVSHKVFRTCADHQLVRAQPESLQVILSALLERPVASDQAEWLNFLQLKEKEAADMPNPTSWSSSRQPHLNFKMRAILVDWMCELWRDASSPRTPPKNRVLFVAVRLLDHYVLQRPGIMRSKLQLVGSLCLSAAGKHESLLELLSDNDIEYWTDHTYTVETIMQQRAQDQALLQQLAQAAVTPLDFLVIFEACAQTRRSDARRDRFAPLLATYLLELALLSPKMISFPPSTQALSAFLLGSLALRSTETVLAAEERLKEHLHTPRVTGSLRACMQQMHFLYKRSAGMPAADADDDEEELTSEDDTVFGRGVSITQKYQKIFIGSTGPIPKILMDADFDTLVSRLHFGVAHSS